MSALVQPQLSGHGFEPPMQTKEQLQTAKLSQEFAELAARLLQPHPAVTQSAQRLQISPLHTASSKQAAAQGGDIVPALARGKRRRSGSRGHGMVVAGDEPEARDYAGPQPYASVFAPAAGSARSTPEPAGLPPAERLRELPELPSGLFQLSGSLQPLVSAFAAAAENTAFESAHWQAGPNTSTSAPAVLTADNLEHSLPSIPLRHTCPCNTQVSLNPLLWRHFEPPFRIMVHIGLRTCVEETEVSLPLGIYSSLNPRVITTGVPTRRSSPYQRRTASIGTTTRQAAASAQEESTPKASGLHLRKSGSYPLAARYESAPARKDKDSFSVKEVILVQRHPRTHRVHNVWRTERAEGEGNTLADTPAWPGEWDVDIIARVDDGEEHSIWLKAMGRSLAASPEACLLSSSGRSRCLA